MIYNDCRDCELYKGDCGNHFIDGYNHINYNIPTESRMDNVIGSHGSCFVASEQYSLETKKEVIEEITRKYSVETIRMALKEKENDEKKPHNTDIENPAIKKWIFERAECNFINHDLWDFKLRCPNCFTVSTFSISPFAVNTFSEGSKCPVCDEPLIFDPEDMFKNEKAN